MRRTPLSANIVLIVALAICPCQQSAAQAQGGQTTASAEPLTPAQFREQLIAAGASPDAAEYVSAVRVEILRSDERSFAYRETYPDGATRNVSYEFTVDRSYAISSEERAAARANGVNVYRTRYSQTPLDDGSTTMRLEYFVPYDEMPVEVRNRLRPAVAFDWGALFGIRAAVAQSTQPSGVDVILTSTFEEAAEQAFGLLTEILGRGEPLSAVFSALKDFEEIGKLADETFGYLNRLKELEDCARNPTSRVPVPEAERQRTLDQLARIRRQVKEVTLYRVVNLRADAPLALLPYATANQKVGAAAAALLSTLLKPVGTWSDQTLKTFITDTLMAEAEAAVVPCDNVCVDPRTLQSRMPPTAPPPPTPPSAGGQTAGVAPPAGGGQPNASARANSSQIAWTPADCASDRVTIRLTEIEQYWGGYETLDRKATFWATTTVKPIYEGGVWEGTATGRFRDRSDRINPGWCSRTIDGAANATMRVRIRPEIREVQVQIEAAPYQPSESYFERDPQVACSAYTAAYRGPALAITCTFLDVDLQRGGIYKDQNFYDHQDWDDRLLNDCTLRLGGPPEEPPPDDDDSEEPPRDEEDPEEPPPDDDEPVRRSLRSGPPFGSWSPPSSGSVTPAAAAAAAALPASTAGPAAVGAGSQDSRGSGRYRALLAGFRAAAGTVDTPANRDGRGDEVYGAVASMVWDRRANSVSGFRFERTREYGDTGAAGVSPQRVQAGSAGPTGGIAAGDAVPAAQGLAGAASLAAAPNQFPLLVWEGTLTAGREVLVIVPTLWERDTQARVFDAYRIGWLTASLPALMAQPPLAASLVSPALAAVQAPDPQAGDVAGILGRAVAGRYTGVTSALLAADAGADRPIGIGTLTDVGGVYAERYVVVTREKVAALPVGGATTVSVPLRDTDRTRLGGDYEVYLRIERIQ
jgi:hypothetical protein